MSIEAAFARSAQMFSYVGLIAAFAQAKRYILLSFLRFSLRFSSLSFKLALNIFFPSFCRHCTSIDKRDPHKVTTAILGYIPYHRFCKKTLCGNRLFERAHAIKICWKRKLRRNLNARFFPHHVHRHVLVLYPLILLHGWLYGVARFLLPLNIMLLILLLLSHSIQGRNKQYG